MSTLRPDYLLHSPRSPRRLHGAALKSAQLRKRRERRAYLGLLALVSTGGYAVHEHIALQTLQSMYANRVAADAEDLVDYAIKQDNTASR